MAAARALFGRVLRQADYQVDRLALSAVLARRYERRNRANRESVLGEIPAIVSLTTFGSRFETAHLAIESIASGTARPQRLILWVDDPEQAAGPTAGLARLINRGLEVRLTEDLGPHTKYFPTLGEFSSGDGRYLVAADDDLLYPRWWLASLWRGVVRHPGEISCHRAHSIRLTDGHITPYATWEPCWDTRPSLRNFATSGFGVAYPPAMIEALRNAGLAFREVAPKADDVWLSAVAARNRIRTRQVHWRPLVWPFIPGSQSEGLFQSNVIEGGNDRQIAAAFTPDIVERLSTEA